MTRKERRIQKALGLGDDIPPTIFDNIQFWIYWKKLRVKHFFWEREYWRWIASRLPKKLVYYCTIRVWAHATTCPSGSGEDVTITTVSDAIQRWEKE